MFGLGGTCCWKEFGGMLNCWPFSPAFAAPFAALGCFGGLVGGTIRVICAAGGPAAAAVAERRYGQHML